jgi:hypothetical protein
MVEMFFFYVVKFLIQNLGQRKPFLPELNSQVFGLKALFV